MQLIEISQIREMDLILLQVGQLVSDILANAESVPLKNYLHLTYLPSRFVDPVSFSIIKNVFLLYISVRNSP